MKLPLFGKKNKTEPVVEKKEEEKARLTENKEEDYSTTLSWSGKSYDTMVQEKEAVKEQQMIFQMMSLYVVCSEESIPLSSSRSRSSPSRQREDKRWPKRNTLSPSFELQQGHKEGEINFVLSLPTPTTTAVLRHCWLSESFLVVGLWCCCFSSSQEV